MIQVILTYPTSEGSREIAIEGERTSFGRGSEADHNFDDEGLSRLHATVYRDGQNIWIVDENSTNGTFVNGAEVNPGGTPLENGDSVRIGHQTNFNVRISEHSEVKASSSAVSVNPVSGTASADPVSYILPIAVIVFAVLAIGISGVFIGINVLGNDGPVAVNPDTYDDSDSEVESEAKTPTPKPGSNGTDNRSNTSNLGNDPGPELEIKEEDKYNLPKGKTYLEMTPDEQSRYVEVKTLNVARRIGNQQTGAIPAAAVASIKKFVDGYARRANTGRQTGSCRFGDNLQSTYERASKNAPFIIKNFYASGLDPQIGLYLAMIESEHCPCLQSPTGPLGLFQFAQAAAKENGLQVRPGASPSNPDERCEQEPASRAAASYMKKLSGRFGTGPLSIPLAIGSYNSGQGALSNNLETALNAEGSQERSFWTLIANAEKLSKQFKMENIKYVPKFFAAAIIGENPQDFGMTIQPLSTYNK